MRKYQGHSGFGVVDANTEDAAEAVVARAARVKEGWGTEARLTLWNILMKDKKGFKDRGKESF